MAAIVIPDNITHHIFIISCEKRALMDIAIKPAMKNEIDSIRDFSNALTEMEQVLKTMAEMVERTDTAWKRDYVELRRQLQLWLTALGAASQQCRAINEQSELAAEMRMGLNRLRSVLALHQADWPVVSIDTKNPGYAASSKNILDAITAFGRVARKLIAEAQAHS